MHSSIQRQINRARSFTFLHRNFHSSLATRAFLAKLGPLVENGREKIRAWIILVLLLFCPIAVPAEPFEEATEALGKGDYATAATKAIEAIEANDWKDGPRIILVRALMAQGKYKEADEAAVKALQKLKQSVRIRLEANEVFRYHGDANRSIAVLAEINQLAGSRGWAYRNAPDLVALGRTAPKLG
ncbi:uncharacterized protein METZ01_LOCUS429706, partial [marine metagenome]